MEIMNERYEIAVERIIQIIEEDIVKEPYRDYFVNVAEFIIKLDQLKEKLKKGFLENATLEQLRENNKSLYEDIYEEQYKTSYANPDYAKKQLGDEYCQELCYLYTMIRKMISDVYLGNLELVVLPMELFIEIYNYFENPDELEHRFIRDAIYSYEKDNAEIFMDMQIEDRIDASKTYAVDIVTKSDLDDVRYVYKYGRHISDNETKMASFLSTLSDAEIENIARIFTEGYRIGFVNAGKDLSIKGTVEIVYNIGFERIVRAAIKQFADMGLKPVIGPVCYSTTQPNKQYWYDHKQDQALYLDKAYTKRKLECAKKAYEDRKDIASMMAGPAVIEVFGEIPFEPKNKESAISFDAKQQKIQSEFTTDYQRMVKDYIKGEERSFTIIAFPIPEFGEDFENMFRETVKINSLEPQKYGVVQQTIIDALDKAEYVRVVGRGDNKTYINVRMNELRNPEKETNFENCLADVNIPLGEVFTSPKLTGTNGVLHVSTVYLNGLKYNDLKITFEDGKIKDYTCKNFDEEDENKKYIKENILFNHDTLPIGEFAIGTNTTAYAIANKYDIVYKLPILIVEKMGPHFAVGDTCYSFEEEIKTYNPNGKEIVARDNEVSILRKTDISKAYFGCHTDITIPYEELGEITAVTSDREEITIIKDGRFVLEGTSLLNEALDE